jgi:hypothetical protein
MTDKKDKTKSQKDFQTDRIFLKEDAEELPLSDDPFSSDHEVTMIATEFPKEKEEDEVTEVTEVSIKKNLEDTDPAIVLNKVAPQPEKKRDVPRSEIPPKRPRRDWDRALIKNALKVAIPLLVLGLITVVGFNFWQARPRRQSTSSPATPTQTPSLLHTSALSFDKEWVDKKPPFAVKSGDVLKMHYYIEGWADPGKDDLNFAIDFHIYSFNGALVHDEPRVLAYTGRVNPEQEKILVMTTLAIKNDIPAGFYRVVIDTVDLRTKNKASLQTRLNVLPK